MDNSILQILKDKETIESSLDLSVQLQQEHNQIVGVLKSLASDDYVKLVQQEKQNWVLTKDGKEYIDIGTPEYRLFHLLKPEGVPMKEIDKNILKLAQNYGMKKKWIKVDKGLLYKNLETIVDDDKEVLLKISNGEQLDKKVIDEMKKRKAIQLEVIKYYKIEKGQNYSEQRKKKVNELTSEMIQNNSWQDLEFKDYNFNSLGKEIGTGNLHPLLKVRQQFREILLEMGFEEMPTNDYVESSFWNFDSLFQPQNHPARDAHDTFFVQDPQNANIKETDYIEKVKQTHENGIDGSTGWNYDWSLQESQKNIMRTHTTAVSAKMLYKLAQQKEFTPKKYFSIDRVFRNENLDQTHLAEFHQIEGLIADRNLGLGHLKQVIRQFFNKIGITQLWFKPAYNPYTEPSMEIFGYHPQLGKKVEIGNSGVFRPEMLRPMGLPEDVNVIAWGLSLERPTMIQYNLSNIRDLIGHKVDTKTVRNNPICIFK